MECVLPWIVLAGQIGIDVHHVVRIDEIDGEIPGLSGRPQLLALGAQPARDEGGGRVVVIVAAERRVVDVADTEEILETIGFDDLAIVRERRVDRFLDLVEVDAEVPLALIGGVIAERRHAVADGLHVGRHIGLPK